MPPEAFALAPAVTLNSFLQVANALRAENAAAAPNQLDPQPATDGAVNA